MMNDVEVMKWVENVLVNMIEKWRGWEQGQTCERVTLDMRFKNFCAAP